MTPAEAVRAQSRLLALLANLVIEGLSEDSRRVVVQIPSLAPHLPEGGTEDWQAEHYRFFGHEVLPWASALLSPEVHLGGPLSAAVSRRYSRAGFQPPSGHEPDHLGIELMFLAWLCERGDTEQSAAFAGDHLRPWLIPLACAGHDAGGFFAEVLELALQLTASFATDSPTPSLDIPAVLDDDRSGLKQVGGWLATPTWSGILWTRSTLTSIAQEAGVAHGFGSRRDVLESTLFAASDSGKLPRLTGAMKDVVTRWDARMDGSGSAPWKHRLKGTSQLLDRLTAAVQAPP